MLELGEEVDTYYTNLMELFQGCLVYFVENANSSFLFAQELEK